MSQSVLDALADAETLRLFAATLPFWPDIQMAKTHADMHTFAEDVHYAQWCGSRALTTDYPAPAFVTREAARAAFRAVPGLREQDCRRQQAYDSGSARLGTLALIDCFCERCAVPALRGE